MINKVLIANRGEIAVRIIRSCHEMGIAVVAVYSTEDREQLHVKLADEGVCIGGPQSASSYLNMTNIINAAYATNCDAIHPGYGFLSENEEFANLVESCGLKFIGPSGDIIGRMGDKIEARKLMEEYGVPTVPGSPGVVNNPQEAEAICEEIGYPVLIKAAGGGGGRGMRRVYKKEDLKKEFENARNEAVSAFNNGDMYIEKLIINPKHIEIQILADSHGNTIHLGERECSIQRKNQKMIEESPSAFVTEEMREEMGKVAVKAAEACNYVNAGTVEFVVDEDRNFYFIEMNTRVQVEHPVTEMVTGVDIIREQLRIAGGLKLKYTQEEIKIDGYAIECRVNAENPLMNFMPSTGTIGFYNPPGGFGTRFDTFLYNGCKISPYYDSMVGKIIVRGDTRLEAIKKMRRAIEETIIDGIETNLGLQYSILYDFDFIRGDYNTGFMEEKLDGMLEVMKRV